MQLSLNEINLKFINRYVDQVSISLIFYLDDVINTEIIISIRRLSVSFLEG